MKTIIRIIFQLLGKTPPFYSASDNDQNILADTFVGAANSEQDRQAGLAKVKGIKAEIINKHYRKSVNTGGN